MGFQPAQKLDCLLDLMTYILMDDLRAIIIWKVILMDDSRAIMLGLWKVSKKGWELDDMLVYCLNSSLDLKMDFL